MQTISMITPISYSKIENLKFTEYVLLYLDENKNIKRAIPDFGETFMSFDSSLIEEAMKADRVAPFKVVQRNKISEENSPVFYIQTNDSGEVVRHYNFGDNTTKLENFLLDSKRRQTVAKLLKKTR